MLKSRTLVALALLVVIGGATAWKLTRRDPHVAATDAKKPLAIPKDIDELEITKPEKPAITLKKDGATWKVTAPYADRADTKAVEQAVDGLAELKLRDVIAESPESYEKVGVKDADVLKVVAKKGGQPVAALLIGKTSNVRLDGDPRVWSTANLKRWALAKEARLWRDRKVVDFPVDQVETIAVAYPAGKVAVKKEAPPAPPPAAPSADGKAPPPSSPGPSGPDKWSLVEGEALIGGALDPNVAVDLAGTLGRLTAEDVAAADAKTGLDAPRARITATLKDGKTQTLLLGAADGKNAYVKVDGQDRVWTIQKFEADRLPATPAAWRDKTVVKVDPAQVTKIDMLKGTTRTVLERSGAETFKATTPASLGDLTAAQTSAILRSVQGLRATRILEGDAAAHGLDKPRGSLTLTLKDGKTVKLLLGAEKDGESAVQVAGQKDIYGVPSYIGGQLVKTPDELKPQPGTTAAAGGDPHGH